jgi:hypothetical protein
MRSRTRKNLAHLKLLRQLFRVFENKAVDPIFHKFVKAVKKVSFSKSLRSREQDIPCKIQRTNR